MLIMSSLFSYLHCHRRQIFREKIYNPVISNLKKCNIQFSLFLSTAVSWIRLYI